MKKGNKKLLWLIPIVALGIAFGKWWEDFARFELIAEGRIQNTQILSWDEFEVERISDFEIEVSEVSKNTAPVTSDNEVANYIMRVFGKYANEATKVAQCESNLNPKAIGGLGEYGVFQIHPIHTRRIEKMGWSFDAMFDYHKNIELARVLFDEQGWRPWSCRYVLK